jgi:hypothetical protein
MMQFEHTDLFGGEANYSWVRRTEINPDKELNRLQVVRMAKKWAGLTGMRCRVEDCGDMIRIDATPAGLLHVVFVTWH